MMFYVYVFRRLLKIDKYFNFFSVRLLSILRCHSFFHPPHNGQ